MYIAVHQSDLRGPRQPTCYVRLSEVLLAARGRAHHVALLRLEPSGRDRLSQHSDRLAQEGIDPCPLVRLHCSPTASPFRPPAHFHLAISIPQIDHVDALALARRRRPELHSEVLKRLVVEDGLKTCQRAAEGQVDHPIRFLEDVVGELLAHVVLNLLDGRLRPDQVCLGLARCLVERVDRLAALDVRDHLVLHLVAGRSQDLVELRLFRGERAHALS